MYNKSNNNILINFLKFPRRTFNEIIENILHFFGIGIRDYLRYILNKNSDKKEFVKILKDANTTQNQKTKLIAFYLPQYHTIDLNNKNFGYGFTEWTNVTKAVPQFIGHNQPQLPIDVGFYDLAHDDVMYRQIELAKMYGIYGFCFHYYWFSGERLLEKPIFNFLKNKDLDFPFCLCWANENWSKLWDGGNKEIIKEQKLLNEDGEKFLKDLLAFFKDERYIKIDNKPLLVIYKPSIFAEDIFKNFIKILREKIKEEGFSDIFILTAQTNEHGNYEEILDGVVEFPPLRLTDKAKHLKTCRINPINKDFTGKIFDMQDYIKNKKYIYDSKYKIFKCVFPSWDNTARKCYTGAFIFNNETPDLYKEWLNGCIQYTKKYHDENEQFVFINAWNEWGEGAHLEPDQKYGYAYLQATKDILDENSK